MANQPEWMQQIARIEAELRSLPEGFVERGRVELIFGVGRRRALQLMAGFGGGNVKGRFVIDRDLLLDKLAAMHLSEAALEERKRRARLALQLRQSRFEVQARRLSLDVAPQECDSRLRDLPRNISLEPGRMAVTFTTAEDLLHTLWLFGQIFSNDLDEIRELYCEQPKEAA